MQDGTISGSVGEFFQRVDQFSFWQQAVPVLLLGLLFAGLLRVASRLGSSAAELAVKATNSPEAGSELSKRRIKALMWCIGLTWLPIPMLGMFAGLTQGAWPALWVTAAILLPPVWIFFGAVIWIAKWLERLLVQSYSVASIVLLYWASIVIVIAIPVVVMFLVSSPARF